MDTTLFLEQFGHLAQSPGGVGKLRNLILDLAVRGKLVEQNPDDEITKEFLDQKIDIQPYEIPSTWCFVHVGQICEIIGGGAIPNTPEYSSGEKLYLLKVSDLNTEFTDGVFINGSSSYISLKSTNKKIAEIGAIVFPKRGGAIATNKKKVLNIKALLDSNLMGVQVAENSKHLLQSPFLFLWLSSWDLSSIQSGTAVPQINKRDIDPILMPLPPLAEQERIVARVDELMQLCDQLEAEQVERDYLRERAVKSTLFHLTSAPSKAEARHYWGYAEHYFQELFDRVSTVQELRATILQLAVQGRLVPQNPDDETASELLKRILDSRRERWQQLMILDYSAKSSNLPSNWKSKYKKAKALKTEPAELPHNWIWCTLEQLSWDSSYGTSEKCDYNGAGSPVLRIPNISGGRLNLEDMKFTLKQNDWDDHTALQTGDFLVVRTNGSSDLVGRGKLIRHDFIVPTFYASYLIRFRIVDFDLIPEWIGLVWNSIHTREWISEIAQTTAGQFNVNKTNLNKTPIPLPPFDERCRILQKVDELMILCNQLAEEVEHSRALSGRLFDSIVYPLFEDVEASI